MPVDSTFYPSNNTVAAATSTYQDDPNFPKIDINITPSKLKRLQRGDHPKSKHLRKRNFRKKK